VYVKEKINKCRGYYLSSSTPVVASSVVTFRGFWAKVVGAKGHFLQQICW